MTQSINIGVLTPFLEGCYFGVLLDQIHSVVRANKGRLFVIQTEKVQKPNAVKYHHFLATENVSGWIILPQAVDEEYLSKLCQLDKPVIMVSREIDNGHCQVILPDNFGGMESIVEHLIEHGHKDIAFVGCFKQYDVRERYEGYCSALKKHGVSYQKDLIFDVINSENLGGQEAALRIINSNLSCTAIAAATDLNALGILDVLKESGYHIPQDIAITGFDDTDFAATSIPPLSSVHQDIAGIGTKAAQVLFERISEKNQALDTIYIKTGLAIRSSCGCDKTECLSSSSMIRTIERDRKVIDYLGEVISFNHDIGQSLIKSDPGEMKNLNWLKVTNFHWACLGLWDKKDVLKKELFIERFFNFEESLPSPLGIKCSTEAFPPEKYLPESTCSGEEDIVWLHPIMTETREWGVLALVGPTDKMKLIYNYDTMVHYYDLLAFALERDELSENRYRNLLNNAGQGFLTFDEDLLIDLEYSSECTKIFHQPIENKVFSDIISPEDVEQRNFLKSILYDIMVEQDERKTKTYFDLLPGEVVINQRNIQIDYKFIEENLTLTGRRKMMVILTDITEKRKLETKIDHERNLLKMIIKVMISYNDFRDMVNDYNVFCKGTLPEIINSNMSIEEISSEILRYIHTFKGNFMQLDLVNTVKRLHDFETEIIEMHKKINTLTMIDFKEFILSRKIHEWLEDDVCILKEILGEQYFNMKNILFISEDRIREIEKKAISTLSYLDCKALLPELRELRYKPFKNLIKSYPEYALKLSHRLEKSIHPFEITGGEFRVDTDKYSSFSKSLINVFRNLLDHGIESPDERIKKGKDEYGTISCNIELKDRKIHLVISDNGKGINTDKVKDVAVKMGIYQEENIHNVPPQELLNLIFKDEFSTKDHITYFSGRGIGLSAVKKEVDKLDGIIEVESRPDEGTSFHFILPCEATIDRMRVSATSFLDPLLESAKNLFCSNFNFELERCSGFNLYQDNKIDLNNITTFINMKGIANSIFTISADKEMLHHMVKSFLLETPSPYSTDIYTGDVMAECTNTIVGNSIESFGDIQDLVAIETPVTVKTEGGFIKYSQSEVWACNMQFKQGNINVGFIFSMNDMD